jgi:hypothetical protein
VPRRVEKSETRSPPRTGGQSSDCALVVDHHSTRKREESRASRCIVQVQYQACLFSARACPVLQSYVSVKRPPLATTPLAFSFALNPKNLCFFFVNLSPFPLSFFKWALHSGPTRPPGCPSVSHWPIGVVVYATFAITVRPRKKVKFGCSLVLFLYFGSRTFSLCRRDDCSRETIDRKPSAVET